MIFRRDGWHFCRNRLLYGIMTTRNDEFHEAVDGFLRRIETGEFRFLLPDDRGLWENRPGYLYHLETELFLQTGGGCEFRLPYRAFDLRSGDILLIPPGMPHKEKACSKNGCPFRNFVLTTSLREATFHMAAGASEPSVPWVARRIVLRNADFYFHLNQTLAVLRSGEPESAGGGLRGHLLAALLLQLRRELDILPEKSPEPEPHPRLSLKTRLAKKYIDANFPSRFPDVPEIARAANCSPNYLSGLFRRETGMTIKEYVNALKFDYARKMLETGRFNVSEVAGSCGFNDISYFARKFRERFGLKPSELR